MLNVSNMAIGNVCPTGMIARHAKVPHVPIAPEEISVGVERYRKGRPSIVHFYTCDDNKGSQPIPYLGYKQFSRQALSGSSSCRSNLVLSGADSTLMPVDQSQWRTATAGC